MQIQGQSLSSQDKPSPFIITGGLDDVHPIGDSQDSVSEEGVVSEDNRLIQKKKNLELIYKNQVNRYDKKLEESIRLLQSLEAHTDLAEEFSPDMKSIRRRQRRAQNPTFPLTQTNPVFGHASEQTEERGLHHEKDHSTSMEKLIKKAREGNLGAITALGNLSKEEMRQELLREIEEKKLRAVKESETENETERAIEKEEEAGQLSPMEQLIEDAKAGSLGAITALSQMNEKTIYDHTIYAQEVDPVRSFSTAKQVEKISKAHEKVSDQFKVFLAKQTEYTELQKEALDGVVSAILFLGQQDLYLSDDMLQDGHDDRMVAHSLRYLNYLNTLNRSDFMGEFNHLYQRALEGSIGAITGLANGVRYLDSLEQEIPEEGVTRTERIIEAIRAMLSQAGGIKTLSDFLDLMSLLGALGMGSLPLSLVVNIQEVLTQFVQSSLSTMGSAEEKRDFVSMIAQHVSALNVPIVLPDFENSIQTDNHLEQERVGEEDVEADDHRLHELLIGHDEGVDSEDHVFKEVKVSHLLHLKSEKRDTEAMVDAVLEEKEVHDNKVAAIDQGVKAGLSKTHALISGNKEEQVQEGAVGEKISAVPSELRTEKTPVNSQDKKDKLSDEVVVQVDDKTSLEREQEKDVTEGSKEGAYPVARNHFYTTFMDVADSSDVHEIA